ncbi:MAG TPA: type IX secretion system protein PorQ [Bacteroidia bacterium]|jgi:hypothetical protein|nr:type IX secretion system protein PorQ [Bacteroidia bacterium]
MLRKSFLTLSIFIVTIPAFAQIGGDAAFTSLDLPMSARAAALGGRAVAINDNDLNLATWNPALLNSTMSSQMALSFADYISDIKYGYAAFAWNFKKVGTFGLNATRIDYGTFRETDNTGAQIGTFTAGEYGINASFSRMLDSNFTIGVNARFIQSNLYLWKANGLGFDAAILYARPRHNFSATILARNVGVMMDQYTYGDKEKLPFEVEAGLAFKPQHAPFRISLSLVNLQKWDLTYTDPNNPPQLVDPLTGDSIKTSKFRSFNDKLGRHIVVGGELLIGKAVSLRFGYNYDRRKELMLSTRHGATGFTFGAGVRIYKFNISYAHCAYHLAGSTNTFTITTQLSDFYHH